MGKIILYSSGICPKCNVLKVKMKNANIDFTNISGNDAIASGIKEVPVLEVDGLRMNFKDAVEWINNKKG